LFLNNKKYIIENSHLNFIENQLKNMEKLFDAIYKLKKLKRTGWPMVGVVNGESVAEHVYAVAMFALIYNNDFGCDKDKLVTMALLHDLGESKIGDIVTDIGKNVVYSKEEKKHQEIEAVTELLKDDKDLLELYIECLEGKTKEARILIQLEKYEMMLQAYNYEKSGGSTKEQIQEFWDYADDFFKGKEVESMYLELKKKREGLK
jgi:putative hydrolase of HD superfamily